MDKEQDSIVLFFLFHGDETEFGGRNNSTDFPRGKCSWLREKLLSCHPCNTTSGMLGRKALPAGGVRWGGVSWGGSWQPVGFQWSECVHRAECFCSAARDSDSLDFNFDVSIFSHDSLIIEHGI